MDTRRKLDPSSPIVQHVFRLRERMAQSKTEVAEGMESLAGGAQTKKGYQWQMWQKSDFSAYEGDGGDVEGESGHVCK